MESIDKIREGLKTPVPAADFVETLDREIELRDLEQKYDKDSLISALLRIHRLAPPTGAIHPIVGQIGDIARAALVENGISLR